MKRWIKASSSSTMMNNEAMLAYLKSLDNKLREHDMFGELDVFGGAVMCLGLNARELTHDIDAIFAPKSDMRELIAEVAKENNLSNDWINDGVKGFISDKGEFERFGDDIFTNLTVMMADPKYMFAMKCLSCRNADASSTEIEDIKFLLDYLGTESVEAAESLILEYYPKERFNVRTHYVLLELLS